MSINVFYKRKKFFLARIKQKEDQKLEQSNYNRNTKTDNNKKLINYSRNLLLNHSYLILKSENL